MDGRFTEWLDAAFADPHAADDEPPVPLRRAPDRRLVHLETLLADPVASLAGRTDDEIGHGLWNLFSSDEGEVGRLLLDASLPSEDRLRCLASIQGLYTDLFAPRLTDEPQRWKEDCPLGTACYMLWDIAEIDEGDGGSFREPVLELLEGILAVDHAACQESALHGLGHLRRRRRKEVIRIIDRWLDSGADRHPELIAYARRARAGRVE